jgi:hypothetical protein
MRQSVARVSVFVLTAIVAAAWGGASQAWAQGPTPLAPSSPGVSSAMAPTATPGTTAQPFHGATGGYSSPGTAAPQPATGPTYPASLAPEYPTTTPPSYAATTPLPAVVTAKPQARDNVHYPTAAPVAAKPQATMLPGAAKSPLGAVGDIAVELGLHLLSGNSLSGNLLSGNQQRTLSANNADLLTGNKVRALSDNETKMRDANPLSVASGNKAVEIRKSAGGDLVNSSFSILSGNKVEIHIVNSGNGSANNNRECWNAPSPGEQGAANIGSSSTPSTPASPQFTLPADIVGHPTTFSTPARPSNDASSAIEPVQTTWSSRALAAMLRSDGSSAARDSSVATVAGPPIGAVAGALVGAAVTPPANAEAAARAERFNRLDLNGDGVITLDEYLRATTE